MNLKFAFGLDILIIISFLMCLQCAGRERSEIIPEANFNSVSQLDSEFIKYAIFSNQSEIEFARAALARSGDQQIKDIAFVLERDHAVILDSLLRLAQRKNVSAGIPPALIGTTNLLQLSGSAFNKQWCADMIATHEKGFQMIELVWENSEDREVKDVISASLPHLISHLEWLVEYQENLDRKEVPLPTPGAQIAAN